MRACHIGNIFSQIVFDESRTLPFGAYAVFFLLEGVEQRTVAFRCSDTINYFWGHFTLNLLILFLIIYDDKSTTANAKWPSPARHHTSLFHSLSHPLPSLPPSLPPSSSSHSLKPPPPLPPSLIEEVHSKGGGIEVRFEVLAQHCLVLRMRRIRLECGLVSQVHNKSMGIALRIRAESARWTCNYVSS